jgi:hypothetical protein
MLKHFGAGDDNDSVLGDLSEQYLQKNSAMWYWRQAMGGIAVSFLREIRGHKWIAARALLTGWAIWILCSKSIFPLASPFFFGAWGVWLNPVLGGGILARPLDKWAEFRHVYPFVFAVAFPLIIGAISGWLVARFHRDQRIAVILLFAASILLMNLLLFGQLFLFFRSPETYAFVAAHAANVAASVIGILLGGGLLRSGRSQVAFAAGTSQSERGSGSIGTKRGANTINDTEPNELLHTWKTPSAPTPLRDRVRAGIAARHRTPLRKILRGWKFLVASAAVLAVVFLLANIPTFPEKVSRPPYTVDSEIILHPGTQGCPNCWTGGPKHALMTSYNQAGSEVLLSWSAPGNPLGAVFWAAKLTVDNMVEKLNRRFLLEADREAADHAVVYWTVGQTRILGERAPLVNSGCRPLSRQGEVLGQDVLLNFRTIVDQYDYWKTKVTLWMASQLSCFALRATVEVQQADGTWSLVSEKKALKVTVNRQSGQP